MNNPDKLSIEAKAEIKILKERITKLEASEIENNLLFESIQEGIVFQDAEGKITSANKAAQRLLGLSLDQMKGRKSVDPRWKAIHEDGCDFPGDQHPAMLALKNGKPIRDIIMGVWNKESTNHTWITINATPLFRENEEVPYQVYSIFRNVTEHKRLGADIKETTRRLTTLMDNLPGIAYRCNLDIYWTMEFISNGCKELTGYEPGELLGNRDKTFADIIHYEDQNPVWEQINKALKFSDTFELQYRIITKSNTIKWVWERGRLVTQTENCIPKLEGFITDISNYKNAEKIIYQKNDEYLTANKELEDSLENIQRINLELGKAKKMAEESDHLKTEFLHNMSHEIRTPMNGIMGFSSMLGDPELSLDKRKYYTGIVQHGCQQLLRIIDDILEVSALETKQVKFKPETFSLNSLLSETHTVFSLKANAKNLSFFLKTGLSGEKSTLISDKTKLNKILDNLLENAIKYTNKGFVELGYQLKKEEGAKELELYVKDTGVGIAQEKQDQVFKRFVQENVELSLKTGGLGLGLSIVKENVELLGGKIQLTSKKGEGSTFYITIPYTPAKISNKTSGNKEATISTRSEKSTLTVLIAEDEEVNFLYLNELFRAQKSTKFKIYHALNGKEAVDLCSKAEIDFVIMDIKMPVMDGLEATREIKKLHPAIPIIAHTAYATEEDKQKCLKSGCVGYLSKPLKKDKLFEIMNRELK